MLFRVVLNLLWLNFQVPQMIMRTSRSGVSIHRFVDGDDADVWVDVQAGSGRA
jgi:hypothetical protein